MRRNITNDKKNTHVKHIFRWFVHTLNFFFYFHLIFIQRVFFLIFFISSSCVAMFFVFKVSGIKKKMKRKEEKIKTATTKCEANNIKAHIKELKNEELLARTTFHMLLMFMNDILLYIVYIFFT